jgi:hypothetical protein
MEDNYLCDDIIASPGLCRENINFTCSDIKLDQCRL